MNVDKLMRDIQQEILQRRPQQHHVVGERQRDAPVGSARPWIPIGERLGFKSTYVLSDFIVLEDADFVEAAYDVLLRRPSDPSGFRAALDDLRNGVRGKVQILGDIRFSEEGMARCVHVDGLLLPYKMQQMLNLRFVGRPLSWLMAIIRLPTLLRRLELTQRRHVHEVHSLGRHVNEAGTELERLIDHARTVSEDRVLDLEARFAASDVSVAAREARLREALEKQDARLKEATEAQDACLKEAAEVQDARLKGAVEELEARLKGAMEELERRTAHSGEIAAVAVDSASALDTRLSSLEISQRRTLDVELEKLREDVQGGAAGIRRVEQLAIDTKRMVIDAERRAPRGLIGKPVALEESKGHMSTPVDSASVISRNTLYASLEDNFRGSREDIKQRSLHYLDLIEETMKVTGPGDVIDLGCGRGEWLEVLREHAYRGKGVDLNEVLLDECGERGLDAVFDDALTYLSRLPDDSVAVITSMHLVEHLQFDILVSILDEAWRVLKPGGAIALETPNCENLLMASHWFYLDPTHRNPIPPGLLSWLVGDRGFTDVKVERLTQNRGIQHVEPLGSEVPGSVQLNQLVGMLQASPDYAVVGRKAG